MSHRINGLVLMSLLGVLACEVSSLVPTVAPTVTPDRVATGVAEQKAIAATLTAGAPIQTLPTATLTATPTATNTPAPTAMPIPTATITPTSFRVGDLVQSGVYSIKVISAMRTLASRSGSPFRSPVLEIKVAFFKGGDLVWDDKESRELSVVDSTGRVYTDWDPYTVTQGGTINEQGKFTRTGYLIRFDVPESSTGFRLRYRDLLFIDLGL